jgi:hypothetical protein
MIQTCHLSMTPQPSPATRRLIFWTNQCLAIQESDLCSHPFSVVIIDCRSLIHSFEEAWLLHTHYEGNFCADLLAKEGSKALISYAELFSRPSIIVSQLMADIWGVSFPHAYNI